MSGGDDDLLADKVIMKEERVETKKCKRHIKNDVPLLDISVNPTYKLTSF